MEPQIDFVVTWLDSSDSEWQKSLATYRPNTTGDVSEARFRDMNIFRYWFRAVEQYAPWVRKVFLITNGKFPEWINKDNPKLVLVRHEDYMPQEILPTFNSCAIELHMHKIKGLSEHFVYFNDDIFLNSPVTPDYYFKDGLPCDINKETYYNVPIYTEKDRFGIYMSMLANIGILNRHFRRWDTVRQSPKRWFGTHLGAKGLIMSLLLARQRLFIGFSNFHLEQAYLKTVFDEIWEKEPDFMKESCSRFREEITANPYIFRYWQLATNRFFPKKRDGHFFFLTERRTMDQIERTLLENQGTSICLNDTSLCPDNDYEYIKERLQAILEKKFPQKSMFER